jgi:hypothetical protein
MGSHEAFEKDLPKVRSSHSLKFGVRADVFFPASSSYYFYTSRFFRRRTIMTTLGVLVADSSLGSLMFIEIFVGKDQGCVDIEFCNEETR